MNDFQMTHLANDRINDFRAEADRQRLVRSVRRAPAGSRSAKPRSSRRLSLDFLFGRATA